MSTFPAFFTQPTFLLRPSWSLPLPHRSQLQLGVSFPSVQSFLLHASWSDWRALLSPYNCLFSTFPLKPSTTHHTITFTQSRSQGCGRLENLSRRLIQLPGCVIESCPAGTFRLPWLRFFWAMTRILPSGMAASPKCLPPSCPFGHDCATLGSNPRKPSNQTMLPHKS